MDIPKMSLHLLLPFVVAFFATFCQADFFSETLLGLKNELTDSSNSLYDWEESHNSSVCSWSGITCTEDRTTIIGLDISNKNLLGTFSGKHIKLLTDLITLNLSQNSFSGNLPVEIFSLSNLTTLDISRNNFSDAFPTGISSLQNLIILDAFSNSFTGSLPDDDIVNLNSLKILNLAGSYFQGPIPESYGSFKSLEFLHLAGNLLTGAIPQTLGRLKTMTHMEIGYNSYQGNLPWQLGNMSELQYLDIAGANLSGPIPESLCSLSKLQSLFLFRNQLTEWIPWCFGNLKSLLSLDLSDNFISGSIPQTFSNLTNIRLLSLMYNEISGLVPQGISDLPFLDTLLIWNNYFTGELPKMLGKNGKLRYLDVSTNSFTGRIPKEICTGGMLTKLILFSNNFTGELSPALSMCSSLTRLRLEDNQFTGRISLEFRLFQDITYVDLSRNMFTDGIPADISEALKLQYFNVSRNPNLDGIIPTRLWSLPQLENFSASSCGISGSLPAFESCKLVSVIELDGNSLSGIIPDSVGNCVSLDRMSLSENNLSGSIPVEFVTISVLRVLDLSHNAIDGVIPLEFRNSSNLLLLNVSYNDVSGEIPSGEKFESMGVNAFTGNSKLCGRPLQSCPMTDPTVAAFWSDRKASKKPAWVLILCAFMALFILVSIFGIFYLQRERKERWKTVSFLGLPHFKPEDVLKNFTYTTSIEAPPVYTSYCKAVLPTGITVSVKRIEWDVKRKARMEEIITRIGNARHKNLIRLLGVCSDEKVAFLLYDYLPNGNLEEKMRRRGRESVVSTWAAKYKVVLGVSRALCFLHHDCSPAIPHGDLKASNILFDEDMEPHLAEFGLRNLVQAKGKIYKTGSVSGTGEIDALMKEDLSRDIYSFGEILLEILSNGKLRNVEENLHRKPRESVLKEIYKENDVGSTGSLKEEINLVLEIALLCTRTKPVDRPSMEDALKLLSGLKPSKQY
ncbi:hypothetical protein ACHQM5_029791 [Ranunculus cassubicifolius]